MLKFTYQPLSYVVVFDQPIPQALLALLGFCWRYLAELVYNNIVQF